MRCKWKYVVSENLKQKILGGHLVFLIFFLVEGGEQAFVVVIKHLIDFDGNKLSRLSDGYVFYCIKMNIKDRTTGCVSIRFFEITLNEQDQGKVR